MKKYEVTFGPVDADQLAKWADYANEWQYTMTIRPLMTGRRTASEVRKATRGGKPPRKTKIFLNDEMKKKVAKARGTTAAVAKRFNISHTSVSRYRSEYAGK